MIICQIDAQISGMNREDIEHELKVIEDLLMLSGGELIDADISLRHSCLVAYVRAESELIVNDIFEASVFIVDQVFYLGPLHASYREFESPVRKPAVTQNAQPSVTAWLDVNPAFG
jgi:hypothetical protein